MEDRDKDRLARLTAVLGGVQVVDEILNGSRTAHHEPAVRLRFDEHGYRVSLPGLKAAVLPPDRTYRFSQPLENDREVDYAGLLAMIMPFFAGMEFLPEEVFVGQSALLFDQIRADVTTAAVLNGPCVPVCIPRIPAEDYGVLLKRLILVLELAFAARFPGRRFSFYRPDLENLVEIVPESRQVLLLAELMEGPVAGVYCPAALQGYSVDAAREQMSDLPLGWVLAGGIETVFSIATWLSMFCASDYTPGIEMAALDYRHPQGWRSTLSTGVGAETVFRIGNADRLENADEASSPGLFFIGNQR